MTKGTRVRISHPMMPMERFEGVVVGTTKAGLRVRYDCFGVMMTETFWPTRVEAI